MKTLREYLDQLDEISRRDFLKGAGATAGLAAVGGLPNLAKANTPAAPKVLANTPLPPAWYKLPDAGGRAIAIDRAIILYIFAENNDPQTANIVKQALNEYFKTVNLPDVFTTRYNIWKGSLDKTKEADPQKYQQSMTTVLSNAQKTIGIVNALTNEAKKISNESIAEEEVDEAATPDAVKRIEELVKYK